MSNRKRRNGNAMLMVLIIGSAVATVAFTGVGLAGSLSKTSSSIEAKLKMDWALTGAGEMAKSDLFAKKLAAGGSKTYTVGGRQILVQVMDNSSSMANTVKLNLTGAYNGRPMARTQVLALSKAVITTIWSHGIFSNAGFNWAAGTNVSGSVYFRNSISVSSTDGKVSQDFKTTTLFNPMGLIKVDGAILTGLKAYTWPTLSASTYTANASSVLTGNQTISGYTFPVNNALVVVNGNLTLNNATITRSGTFFVTGSVSVNRLTRTNPNDHVAIITPNSITFASSSGTVTVEGYFFAGTTAYINSPMSVNGAVLAGSYSGSRSMNVTWDQWIMADPANGAALKAPGLWP